MTQFEDELRAALRVKQPSAGLARGVLGRIETIPRSKTRSRMLAGALASCILLAVAGPWYAAYQRKQAQGRAAKAQLMVALRVAASKLNIAQRKVQGLNR